MSAAPVDAQAVTLLCEPRARALLAPRRLRLRILRPPYAALGVGRLRVLRVRDDGDASEVTAGYDRYERAAR
jgi:hypothetical protein